MDVMKAGAREDIVDRTARARDALRSCGLCPRNCRVDRTAGATGFCGLTDTARSFREVLHYGEEEELVPSHQVYFAGCNLRCEWCTVADWNESPQDVPELDVQAMRECIRRRHAEGARSLNLLGGEPTVSLAGILPLLGDLPAGLSVVWNSNMYFSQTAAALLDGVVDVYLADFKCGNETCSERLLGAADYVETVKENLAFARSSADLIVRYLVLPGHGSCCMGPIFHWLKEAIPDVKLSIRADYLPPVAGEHAPMRLPDEREVAGTFDLAERLNLNVIC